jgi:branched-chain amino acid transport system substrate-binding protein
MFRSNRVLATMAAIVISGLALAGCGTTDDDSDNADTTAGPACDLKLAFMGALTGPAAGLGIAAVNGAELAVDQYNEENPDCTVAFTKHDSQSDPKQAPGVAKSIIDDAKVIGLVGPLFSGESEAADPLFDEAGLPMITASATKPTLSEQGWEYFHRILGNDETQGPEVAKVLTDVAEATKPFTISDDSAYGQFLTGAANEALGDALVGSDKIATGQRDFESTVTKVLSADADAVFFGGYYPEGELLIKQLRSGGWDGTFVVPDGVKDNEYIEVGGQAAEGTLVTCPCVPGDKLGEFAEAYKAKFKEEPGTYGPEAYDAANVFLDGIADGVKTRADMNDFINSYDEEGITKHIQFTENGESSEIPIWLYELKNGEFVAVEQLA